MTAAGTRVLSAAELAERLLAPDAGEALSPLGGPGRIVLDLASASSRLPEAARRRIERALPLLPCVTVALLAEGEEDSTAGALAALCDVRVANEGELAVLLEGFADSPFAALAFVQLLRAAPHDAVHAGLMAESFVYSTLQAGPEFRRWLEARSRRRRRDEPEGPACRLERDRGRLEIELSRPHKHNAFSRAMRDSLCEGLQVALADPTIEEIVLRGADPSFCSGGDLDEFGSFPDPTHAHVIRATRSPALLLWQLAPRVRCEVQGACIGAGAELPAFTGRVVASEDAFFGLPEVGLGLVPGAGGSVSLPARIGRQRTAWLGLSGQRIDARTALEWGLVDEVRLGQHP